jgi:hypothetical protein
LQALGGGLQEGGAGCTTRAATNTGSATTQRGACQRSTWPLAWCSASTSTPWRPSAMRSTLQPVRN